MKIFLLLNNVLVLLFAITVSGFGGSEDKFLKKYAMMKIYESCFGPEVVIQIRKEMKAASTKCMSVELPPATTPPPPTTPPAAIKDEMPNFDAEKLHQAILAYRPNSAAPSSFYRPFAPSASISPFFNPAFAAPTPYQSPMFYPGFPQQPQQYSPYAPFPLLGQQQQQYYGNRVSRDMDIRAQLEALTTRMSGKLRVVRNVTCVMQELGYLDENLEPNYQKITERIGGLPVSDELKRDMQDGVSFCQQFSQCVPDVKKDRSPLSRELIKPMFFFKCYKHKKLEACIMKDVREKYALESVDEEDSEVELRRTGKSRNMPTAEEEIEELASSMYEFLYGGESSIDIDGFL